MTTLPTKPCAVCGKKINPWQQFGPDYLNPMCLECWRNSDEKNDEANNLKKDLDEAREQLEDAEEELAESQSKVWSCEGEVRAIERELEKLDQEHVKTVSQLQVLLPLKKALP